MDIAIEKSQDLKPKPEGESTLGFGRIFTDHIFKMNYTADKGWHNARIEPFKELCLHPAASVLHYGQEIFEGIKAFYSQGDEILLFRPEDYASRFEVSAERMCMPVIDHGEVVEAIKTLVDIDRGWVPKSDGTSLYIRPTMIATGKELGSHAASEYLFFIICAATGTYYSKGLKPLKLCVEEEYVRASHGGVGSAKTGGNYARSFKAAEKAKKKGFEQVIWLDGNERKYIQESGAMNVLFVIGDKLCTPELDGSILPGITRVSILQLARDMGIETEERKISIDELLVVARAGELKEAFGSGTAAVVAPIGEITYGGEKMVINGGLTGPTTRKLYDALTNIQRGNAPDVHNWLLKI